MRVFLLAILTMGLAGCASAPVTEVPFTPVRPQFLPGDAIVIDDVRGASSSIKVGDPVVVRGHYTLVSRQEATLRLALYTGSRANAGNRADSLEAGIAALKGEKIAYVSRHEPSVTQPESVTTVSAGNGKFELSLHAKAAGELAAMFVAPSGGRPFGKVFFAFVREMIEPEGRILAPAARSTQTIIR